MEEFGVLLVHPENNFFIALSTLSLFSLSFLNNLSDYTANGKKATYCREMQLE